MAIARDAILDLLVEDIEKCERQLENVEEAQKGFYTRCIEHLETESPLCELPLSDAEKETLQSMSVLSLKPVIVIDGEKTTPTSSSSASTRPGSVFSIRSVPRRSTPGPRAGTATS